MHTSYHFRHWLSTCPCDKTRQVELLVLSQSIGLYGCLGDSCHNPPTACQLACQLQVGPFPVELCPADSSSVLSTLIVSDNNLSGPLRVSLCSRLMLLDVQVGAVLG